MKPHHRLAVLSFSLWLAACGGGGGGGDGAGSSAVQLPSGTRSLPASAGSDLSQANFSARGSATIEALLTSYGGNVLEQPLAAGGAAAASRVDPRAADATVRWALRWALRRAAAAAARERPQAVHTETVACDRSGSVVVSWNDADNDELLSGGDTIAMQFNDCVFDAGTPAADGAANLAVNAVELDRNDAPVALDVSIAYRSFSVEGLGSLSGGARLWSVPVAGGARTLLRYTAMRADFGTESVVLNFDVDSRLAGTALTTNLNGALTLSGQAYKLTQMLPFTSGIAARPESGTLRVADAAGDHVDITARGSVVDLDFYPAGSSVPTAVQHGIPWASFDGA